MFRLRIMSIYSIVTVSFIGGQTIMNNEKFLRLLLNNVVYRIENIIGAVNGTHIRLFCAPNGDQDYYNRKRFPSIQLQVICYLHYSLYFFISIFSHTTQLEEKYNQSVDKYEMTLPIFKLV